ncbi:restriction endonuclease subunit S [Streptococcus suis]|uniref:restriction endonuclease subunit S n=1 Tax=Streptococcus suis TaxID=1307 RepID=UPI000CF42BE5|nr:restriction endonuclease subunit S [Streptococcus suis]
MSEVEFISLVDSGIEILDGDRGKNYPAKSDLAKHGDCVFLNTGNVKNNGFDFSDVDFISFEKDFSLRNGKLLREDIVMTTRGTVGNLAYYSKDIRFNHIRINSGMVIIRVNQENWIPYFIYLFLQSDLFKKQTQKLISGSAQPQLPISVLETIRIPNYSMKQQEFIAIQIQAIDQKIALNNQINEELEAMAKTLYDYWFVQFDFPDENGKPYKSSGGKMVYNAQLKREIPEGWGVETLSGLGTIVGGSTPSKSNLDNFVKSGQGISWITPNDLSKNKGNKFISKGEIDISEVGRLSANLKIFPKGTVLLSSRAPIGYLAIASNELTTNQGFKSFIPNKEYDENYIYYVIKQSMKVIEQNASGSTFKEISSTVLGEILVVKPKINLIKKFQEKVVNINNQIYVNEVQNQELSQLRDWLLPMLMNGQVKVE